MAREADAQDASYFMDTPNYVAMGGMNLQAVIAQTFEFDSNPLLLTTPTKSLWGSITSPEAILVDKTPTASITSDTIFSSNNFNQGDFDSNDVHSKLDFADQNEKWTTNVLGNIDYDTTRTSEFSAYNNIRTIPIRHTGETITPQISYNFEPDDKLGLAGGYTHSTYAGTAFTDYQSYSATPSYSHAFDQRDTGIFSFNVQRYQALEGAANITDTLGPSVGWTKIFTEQLTGNATVGFQETRQSTSTIPNPSFSPYVNYNVGLNYKGSQDLLSATASRSQYPFGNGTEALLTQLTLAESHAINPKFSIGGQGSYQSATYQADATGDLKSIASGTGNLTYHATDEIDLTASYEYEYETLENVSSSANKNVGLISLTFHPMPWKL